MGKIILLAMLVLTLGIGVTSLEARHSRACMGMGMGFSAPVVCRPVYPQPVLMYDPFYGYYYVYPAAVYAPVVVVPPQPSLQLQWNFRIR